MTQTSCQTKIGFAYDMLTPLREIGIEDITEGKYPQIPPPVTLQNWHDYLSAQRRKHDYLLAQAGCKPGMRLLDIGCGNGPLLRRARKKGIIGYGVTLSETQTAHCRKQGLQVMVCDFRELPGDFTGLFDAVIASGSLEHFATIDDAIHGNDDRVYWEMFDTVHTLLKPGGRFVTTAIHFKKPNQVDPFEIAKEPYAHPVEFQEYHFAMILKQVLHGWYPYIGQLEKCAAGLFETIACEDGTYDYFLTSEFWLSQARWSLLKPWVLWQLFCIGCTYPQDFRDAFRHYIWDQSWMWQFRGSDPPTRLLRHTWQAI